MLLVARDINNQSLWQIKTLFSIRQKIDFYLSNIPSAELRGHNCLNFKFMAEINVTVMFIGYISILCRIAWATLPFYQRCNHEIGINLPILSL